MTVSIWQTPDSFSPRRVDVVVVGAGLLGAYMALRLRETHENVLVLEARHVAGGASGRNGGLLLSGIAHSYAQACQLYGRATARDLWALTVRNREAMMDWAIRFGTPVRRCGSYVLASNAAQAEELHESAALLREDGFDVRWHPTDPLGRGFGCAIETPDDGAIQAALLVQALLRASGAQVRETAEVYALETRDDGVLVRARAGDVLAGRVVLAANAWLPLLVAEFAGVIVPGRGQVLATAPAPHILDPGCYCDDGFEYFQQLPDGRVVLGGYRNLAFAEETTYADNTTPTIQAALDDFIARHLPELVDVPVERRWSGTMAFSPDGLPLIGKLARDERIAFIMACNGHGLGFGIMAADQLLSELNGATTSLFAARRLMTGVV